MQVDPTLSILDSHSKPAHKTELDLFSVPETQTSIISHHTVYHHPLSTLTDQGPVEFFISGSGEEYIDPNDITAHITCRITRPDGTALKEKANVAPSNFMLHNLWSQIDLSLNDTLITNSSSTYAHTAYVNTILTASRQAEKTALVLQGWAKDKGKDPSSMDLNLNKGHATRVDWAAKSRDIDMKGKLQLDLCKQKNLLPHQVALRLKLVRNPDAFCLGVGEGPDANVKYKIQLVNVALEVRKCKINPNTLKAHTELSLKHTFKYPIKRTVTKVFTEPGHSMSINKENIFLGQLPHRVIIGLMNTNAYHGHYNLNPFFFHHYNIDYIALHLNGRTIPSRPLRPNFAHNNYARSYHQTMEAYNAIDSNITNTISYNEFGSGYSLFAFDLTPDQSAHQPQHLNLIKNGTLRLEIHFKEALPHTISILIQGEFDNLIEIDRFRNVLLDYSH